MLVGIDLGTTNSLVACFRDGKAQVIPNRLGKLLTPSVVAIDENGMILVGEVAREYGMLHPLSVASVFKRSMGTNRIFELDGMNFSAEELSRFVLRSLKEDAEVFLGCEVDQAIISVPAYFNDLQRKATKRAGELAGLKVARIINEPTAAAIAHGVGGAAARPSEQTKETGVSLVAVTSVQAAQDVQEEPKDERCLVFDLGGGTFDVSVLEFFACIMEVHAIAGDNFIGGQDFTELLETMFLARIGVARTVLDERAQVELTRAAEEAKCKFSTCVAPAETAAAAPETPAAADAHSETPTVTMTWVFANKTYSESFTLEEYEQACQPLLERLRRPIERSLRDADIHLNEIDRIILVGGATRLPVVRHFVEKVFRRAPETLVDPDTAVALGAALQCGMKMRDAEISEVVLTDVCPFTLGTEVVAGNGTFEESGHFLPIIERNTVIPVSRRQRVSTVYDNQTQVMVKILQGESRMAANNLLLGDITVAVPPAPRGGQAIDIIFTYDVNSLLEVEVCVVSTGETHKIVVQNEEHKISDEQAAQRFERLSYLKQNPREDEANRLQLLRGERMYEEATGKRREEIDAAMLSFDRALARQDFYEIEIAREQLRKFLDSLEQ